MSVIISLRVSDTTAKALKKAGVSKVLHALIKKWEKKV